MADGAATLPALLRALDLDGIRVSSVEVRRPSLDDVFLDLTGRSLRDQSMDTTGVEYMRIARETWIVFPRAMRLSLRNPV